MSKPEGVKIPLRRRTHDEILNKLLFDFAVYNQKCNSHALKIQRLEESNSDLKAFISGFIKGSDERIKALEERIKKLEDEKENRFLKIVQC